MSTSDASHSEKESQSNDNIVESPGRNRKLKGKPVRVTIDLSDLREDAQALAKAIKNGDCVINDAKIAMYDWTAENESFYMNELGLSFDTVGRRVSRLVVSFAQRKIDLALGSLSLNSLTDMDWISDGTEMDLIKARITALEAGQRHIQKSMDALVEDMEERRAARRTTTALGEAGSSSSSGMNSTGVNSAGVNSAGSSSVDRNSADGSSTGSSSTGSSSTGSSSTGSSAAGRDAAGSSAAGRSPAGSSAAGRGAALTPKRLLGAQTRGSAKKQARFDDLGESP